MAKPDLLQLKKKNPKELGENETINEGYEQSVNLKLEGLNDTLKGGISDFSQLKLRKASKAFRKLANDLQMLDTAIYKRGKSSPKNSLNDLTGKEWLKHTKSWLVVDGRPGTLSKEIKNHPASFPPELAEHFISYFTKRDGWVLDPFMGIGSTMEACYATKRNCLGAELNPEFARYAYSRIKRHLSKSTVEFRENTLNKVDAQPEEGGCTLQLFHGDARKLGDIWNKESLPLTDFLITSPPYWNILKKSRGGVKSSLKQRLEKGLDGDYGNSDLDFGNIQNYESYLSELTELFASFKPLLKPKAYLMVILQNTRRKDGIMQPIAWDFARSLSEVYELKQEFIWTQDQKYMGIWGWPTTYVSNVHHHYCLVFQNTGKK